MSHHGCRKVWKLQRHQYHSVPERALGGSLHHLLASEFSSSVGSLQVLPYDVASPSMAPTLSRSHRLTWAMYLSFRSMSECYVPLCTPLLHSQFSWSYIWLSTCTLSCSGRSESLRRKRCPLGTAVVYFELSFPARHVFRSEPNCKQKHE